MAGATPADAVAAMCGAHAQVLSAAELSVGLRLAGTTRSGVGDALWGERSLVKTFGPRGTVHLLPTRDLPTWVGALSALPERRSLFADGVRLTDEQTRLVLTARPRDEITPVAQPVGYETTTVGLRCNRAAAR